MIYLKISDDNANIKTYHLDSYEIVLNKESVIVKFSSSDFNVIYDLRSDTRFPSLDHIKEYLEKILETVVSEKYTLQISEYLKRMYVTIGYETDEEYEKAQFTASKLN